MKKLKISQKKSLFTLVFLLGLALGFFILTSSYNVINQKGGYVKWGSPDETANYVFAKLYAETGELKMFERNNLFVSDLMHIRSIRSDYGFLKPMSFLGIILIFGKIGSFLGTGTLPYLTPFFGALGLVAFYFLLKKLFDRSTAVIGSLILAFFPVLLYYSARSFFHNVLFISLLLIGAAFLAYSRSSKRWRDLILIALSGLFIGGALLTRTSEALWLLPALGLVWLFNIKRFDVIKIILFLAFLWTALLPMFYHNKVLYGSFFYSGYSEMNSSLEKIVVAQQTSGTSLLEKVDKIKDMVFYFGFKPDYSLKMLNNYFVRMFPALLVCSLVGLLWFLIDYKKIRRRHLAYFSAWALSSLILIIYYGSWKFSDNPDPRRFTIGNSYTRYWLPFYVGTITLSALFVVRFTKLIFRTKVLIWSARACLLTAWAFWSLNFTLFGSEEGLVPTYYVNLENRQLYQEVMSLTPHNAVIITRYHDKVFFPERKVIVGLLDNPEVNKLYGRLLNYLPVYYFHFAFKDEDLKYLNERKLSEFGYHLEEIKRLDKNFALYELKKN